MPRRPRIQNQRDAQSRPSRRHDDTPAPKVQTSLGVYTLEVLDKLDDNLFLIQATSFVRRFAKINRNMVVLRHNKRELTLINPVRLDADGEARLLQLGGIARIIRLAPNHGTNHDRYYIDKFPQVRRWAPARSAADSHDPNLPVHRLLTDDDDAILPACHVFCFQETAQPECALLILQDYVGNLLVTSDSLQSHQANPLVNMPVRAKLAAEGMLAGKIHISSAWLRSASHTRSHRQKALRGEFERLLRLDFARMVGSSGTMVYEGAKEGTVLAVERTFPLL
jgi:hypothetical protein